jgi:hypothetical protein
MKALTLTQPYATLVAIGAKRIETRSWSTRYRGPLAIHAAKSLRPVGGTNGLTELCHTELFVHALAHHGYVVQIPGYATPLPLPLGVIVANCTLVDVVPVEDVLCRVQIRPRDYDTGYYLWSVDDSERAFGDYTPGRYAWLLADVRPIDPPIPATGRQGLWEWADRT